jgi:hypothetical protein
MQILVTQGLLSTHVVDVKLDSILIAIAGCCRCLFPATPSIKTVEYEMIIKIMIIGLITTYQKYIW